jgi:hypothetical protein
MDEQPIEAPEVDSKLYSQDSPRLQCASFTEDEREQLGNDSGDDDEFEDLDDMFRKWKEEDLASINRQCFTILQHLQSCGELSDEHYHLYQFQDDKGECLEHDMREALSLTEVRQTPGYRVLRKYCKILHWECSLTEVYHPHYAYEGSTFVHRFGPGCGTPVKSFQVMIRGACKTTCRR